MLLALDRLVLFAGAVEWRERPLELGPVSSCFDGPRQALQAYAQTFGLSWIESFALYGDCLTEVLQATEHDDHTACDKLCPWECWRGPSPVAPRGRDGKGYNSP